jgi:hypothetical protein
MKIQDKVKYKHPYLNLEEIDRFTITILATMN